MSSSNMNSKYKVILAAIVVLALAGVAFAFRYSFGTNTGSASPVGTLNSSAKFYSTVFSLASASGTTTSIQNNSGFDWAIESTSVQCNTVGTSKVAYTGGGLANLNIKGATTSTAFTGNVTDANANYGTNMNVGTSTVDDFAATSTEGIIQGTSRIIPNGAYYTFSSNATNTASCTVGVHVFNL